MSEEALQIAEERRKAKGKGERERYTHLNAEFQRRAKRDKKAFLNETVRDYLGGSKITADGDYSHEIKKKKKLLLLGRKAITNLDNVLKSMDITANKSL